MDYSEDDFAAWKRRQKENQEAHYQRYKSEKVHGSFTIEEFRNSKWIRKEPCAVGGYPQTDNETLISVVSKEEVERMYHKETFRSMDLNGFCRVLLDKNYAIIL